MCRFDGVTYFTDEYFQFLVDLNFNNSKAWFDENRKRYEQHVREPFKRFVTDLTFRVQEIDEEVLIEPKHAIFRINRDTRFSKDKTAYKTHMGAVLGRVKRQEPDFASFYIQLSPTESFVAGGAYFVDSKHLLSLRRYIRDNPDDLIAVIENPVFKGTYPEIMGERNKRLPKELQGVDLPLIANKKFYVSSPLDTKLVTSADLMDTVLERYRILLPFFRYLRTGLVYSHD